MNHFIPSCKDAKIYTVCICTIDRCSVKCMKTNLEQLDIFIGNKIKVILNGSFSGSLSYFKAGNPCIFVYIIDSLFSEFIHRRGTRESSIICKKEVEIISVHHALFKMPRIAPINATIPKRRAKARRIFLVENPCAL